MTAPGSTATLALVVAYAIGAGLPLLAIALGGRAALARLHLRSASARAGRAFGVLVLATAGLMAVGADTAISADLTSALPDWTGTLQTLERSNPVQAALERPGRGLGRQPGFRIGSDLTDGPLAPEFTGIDHWLNSPPLTMAGLRGKVVLVDFWTYSCINCIRTLPYVESWYQKYARRRLRRRRRAHARVRLRARHVQRAAAIARFGITYPVAQDNEYATWTAYNNEYWPADYLIDAKGHIRTPTSARATTSRPRREIRSLLAEAGQSALPSPATSAAAAAFHRGRDAGNLSRHQSGRQPSPVPACRRPGRGSSRSPASCRTASSQSRAASTSSPNTSSLRHAGDKLEMSFMARDVYLVMAADSPVQATVTVTGARTSATEDVSAGGAMVIGQARLYHLVHLRFRCAWRGDDHLQRPGRARVCLHVRRLTRPTQADSRGGRSSAAGSSAAWFRAAGRSLAFGRAGGSQPYRLAGVLAESVREG